MALDLVERACRSPPALLLLAVVGLEPARSLLSVAETLGDAPVEVAGVAAPEMRCWTLLLRDLLAFAGPHHPKSPLHFLVHRRTVSLLAAVMIR